MPLLVNALQENSYVRPSPETTTVNLRKQKSYSSFGRPTTVPPPRPIEKSSPRPFLQQHKNTSPSPFSKGFSSRTWAESYRNAQRLRNLNQVIKYLEKTLNAKFGETYQPPTAQIAISGIYVAPMESNENEKPFFSYGNLATRSSQKVEYKSNHLFDPLIIFKPESPGDINLLADGYRFSPIYNSYLRNKNKDIPMFRPIEHRKRNCFRGAYTSTLKESPQTKTTTAPTMIVRFNVYSVRKNKGEGNRFQSEIFSDDGMLSTAYPYTRTYPDISIKTLNSSHVEDYHFGSSGVIPVESRTIYPPVYSSITTPLAPFFNTISSTMETFSTQPPDIIKFSPEDAKIPEDYLSFRKSDISQAEEGDFDIGSLDNKINNETQSITAENQSNIEERDIERETNTLVVKLKNIIKTTTEAPNTEESIEETTEFEETYVPTINGHYRNIMRKTLRNLFNETSEKYRKRRIETAVSLQKSSYVPMYVEIKRNRTYFSIEDN
ncbi:unnamed protein product [Leptidea sinapis]|uniref:Uncharacterized protein n=1 Tax=Leptidea sinapis TaxID=189913 RepID=A0A5E4PWS9_9NEOP|nr:unnamed protein product [Leptidea sinapis]